MITLSYSTLKMIHESSHNWLNKMMGLKVPDNEFFRRGREAHRIIQDHVSGIKKTKELDFIEYEFPIVETVDFDPKCKISFKINEKYEMIGFFDGANREKNRSLEIKTSSKPWTLKQFVESKQRKIYAIGEPWIRENVLITAHFDSSTWGFNKPKIYRLEITEEDKAEAWDWILRGIEIIESGDFSGGLDADGICRNPRCLYSENCQFKKKIK